MRTSIFICVVALVLGSLIGCGEYEYNRRTMRFERVGPRPRPQVQADAEEPESPAEELPSEQMPERGYNPKEKMSRKQNVNLAKGEVYRLYMGDATAQESGSLQNFYLVKQTTPEKLAELLGWLFPSAGSGGSKRLSFLMFSDEETLDQAKTFVSRLDVAPQEAKGKSTTDANGSSWDLAIGLIYGSEFPRQMDSDVRFRVTSLLSQVLKDSGEKTERRWAAGVLASILQTRYSPKDYVVARALLAQTDDLVKGRNYRALVIRYHFIRQLMDRDQEVTARQQAQEVLNAFQALQNTDCYQAILRIVEKNKRTGRQLK